MSPAGHGRALDHGLWRSIAPEITTPVTGDNAIVVKVGAERNRERDRRHNGLVGIGRDKGLAVNAALDFVRKPIHLTGRPQRESRCFLSGR